MKKIDRDMRSSSTLLYRIQRVLNEFGTNGQVLDATSREILFQIADNQFNGIDTTVSDVTRHTHYGTAPTVYLRLKKLAELGLITSKPNPADGRSSLLRLTDLSEKLIKAGAKAVRSAATMQ